MSRITVQYYAQLREQAGASTEQIDTAAATLRDLYDELCSRHGFTLPTDALKVAVNVRFSDWGRAVDDGDTIVFIPPVAGG
jgi:molybdopterin converting factor subunit 1